MDISVAKELLEDVLSFIKNELGTRGSDVTKEDVALLRDVEKALGHEPIDLLYFIGTRSLG